MEVFPFPKSQGFATPKTSDENKSDKRLLFLEDLYLPEVEKCQKVSPLQAYEFMRNAREENGKKFSALHV